MRIKGLKRLISMTVTASLVLGVFAVNSLADTPEAFAGAEVIELETDGTADLNLPEDQENCSSKIYKFTAPKLGIYSFTVRGSIYNSIEAILYNDNGTQLAELTLDGSQVHGGQGTVYKEVLLDKDDTVFLFVNSKNNSIFMGNDVLVRSVQFDYAYKQVGSTEYSITEDRFVYIPCDYVQSDNGAYNFSLNPSAEAKDMQISDYHVRWYAEIGLYGPSFFGQDQTEISYDCTENQAVHFEIYGDDIGSYDNFYICEIDNHLQYSVDPLTNYAAAPGSELTFVSCVEGDDLEGADYTWRGNAFDITPSAPEVVVSDIQGFTNFHVDVYDVYDNEVIRGGYLFAIDQEAATALELNTDTPVAVESVSDYKVFSFTPEWDGTYTFSSSDITEGNPYFAAFNSTYGCIASEDISDASNFGLLDGGWIRVLKDGITNFSKDIELRAGQTYYFAVKGLDGAAAYNIKLSGEEPAATDTPTPAPSTPAPTGTTPAPVTPTPVDRGVGGFIERLYTVALGRPSDPVGKADWIAAVTERGQSGADCARGFLYSPEFLNKGLTNEDFVAVLYRTFFDRVPDQEGFNAWVAALNNGTPKQEIIEGFINSTEWANLCLYYGIRNGGTGTPNATVEPNEQTIGFCRRLYTTCLCREAEEEGLMAWARQLSNQRDSGTGAAHGFFFSAEFINQNVSNEEYVTRLYRTFMDREPEQEGFDAWVARLNEGATREEVFRGFSQSVEFGRICASYGIIREL